MDTITKCLKKLENELAKLYPTSLSDPKDRIIAAHVVEAMTHLNYVKDAYNDLNDVDLIEDFEKADKRLTLCQKREQDILKAVALLYCSRV